MTCVYIRRVPVRAGRRLQRSVQALFSVLHHDPAQSGGATTSVTHLPPVSRHLPPLPPDDRRLQDLMPCPEWVLFAPDADMSETCRPDRLHELLEDGQPLLLLDCRSAMDYNTSHISGAIHVAIPSLMLKRLKKGNISVSSVISGNESRDRFDRLCKTDSIVVYDECTEDVSTTSSGFVSLLIRRLKEDGCRVCLLQGGYRVYALRSGAYKGFVLHYFIV